MTDAYLIGNTVGFSTGLVITILLLVLTFRAVKLPGTPAANIAVAVCGVAWNVGGLAAMWLLLLGEPKEAGDSLVARAIQFSAAAVWPVPLIAIWRPFATHRWQMVGLWILQTGAALSGLMLVTTLWTGTLSGFTIMSAQRVWELTSYNGSAVLVMGMLLLTSSSSTAAPLRGYSLTILAGVIVSSLAIVIGRVVSPPAAYHAVLTVLREQAVLIVVLGTCFLFAHFRFADVFIRNSLRVLFGSAVAVAFMLALHAPFMEHAAALTAYPRAAHVAAATVTAAAALLFVMFADRILERHVARWVLRAPDFRSAAKAFSGQLALVHSESEVLTALEGEARQRLELASAGVLPIDAVPRDDWRRELTDGDVVELHNDRALDRVEIGAKAEILVPIHAAGRIAYAMAVAPGAARGRGLVTEEIQYLRNVAARAGDRVDLLRMARDQAERESREARLVQQITEAELRALRAQIDPHFLFNSLNTIADLIVTRPEQAEAMTLRLARVFRHVLTHAARPLTSIRDEVTFLRNYLDIEQVRFGDRLAVRIDVDPDVATEPIPSLILQPIVENALKHGLAPKPGPVHLWISAREEANDLCLIVEDDGVGPTGVAPESPGSHWWPDSTRRTPSFGVGLTNVADRLSTLYREQAHVRFEARAPGGSRVVVRMPRGTTEAPL